jgi:hypothetical protein
MFPPLSSAKLQTRVNSCNRRRNNGEQEHCSPLNRGLTRPESTFPSFLRNVYLDLVGIMALADIPIVLERTVLAGKAHWSDIFILCPGIHQQQLATELNHGEYPATAALTPGYVFRAENQAPVYFLQKVGKTGRLTTLSVENAGRSQDGYPAEFPGLYGVILLLTSSSLGTLFIIDPWAMAIVGMLMVARLLNILVIRGRSSSPSWKGIREPGVHGDLLILLSQDRWVRMQGLVDDLKAVTSGQWLSDASFTESMTTSAATLLVYLAAALTINASQTGKILLLLVVSGGLLAIYNESVDTLQMNGFRVRHKGKPIAYRRRLDLADQLVEKSGRGD